MSWLTRIACVLCAFIAACGVPREPAWRSAPYAARSPATVAQLTALGRALFFEPALSASGRVSCASCHDPRFAYGPPNGDSVQRAGSDANTPGLRAAPSLRYLQTLPPFTEHHFDNDGDSSIDAGPTGGHTWDGRADSSHDQARLPLLSGMEMANASPEAVVERLAGSAQAARFRSTFGAQVFDDPRAAFDGLLMALEVFQQSAKDFYPYTSRYDAMLRGAETLTPQEARGLALFNDERKGNCASCHLSAPTPDGAFPLFTDFGLIAIGVPRHRGLPANADPTHVDLGLCGPLRDDFKDRPDYCGRFRTPTLRNVALRGAFFHNGVMHTLEDAVRFYALRDIEPDRYYRGGKYDDLPVALHGNVNHDPPFDRKPGDPPALTEQEIADVVAFLKTLTDADVARTGSTTRDN